MEVFSNISSNLPPHTTPWRCHPSFTFSPCEACLRQDLWLCLWEEKVSCSREQQQNKSSRVKPWCCSPPTAPCAGEGGPAWLPGWAMSLGMSPLLLALSSGRRTRLLLSLPLLSLRHWVFQQHPDHPTRLLGSFAPTPMGQCGWRGDSQHPTLCRAPGSLAHCLQNSQGKKPLHVLLPLIRPDPASGYTC